jgi:hypothetical protein
MVSGKTIISSCAVKEVCRDYIHHSEPFFSRSIQGSQGLQDFGCGCLDEDQCPDITWKGSFATLGRFDVVDFVEADDPKQIEKAAMLIRAYGHSITETLVATPWKEFLSEL